MRELSRREFLEGAGALGLLAVLTRVCPSWASSTHEAVAVVDQTRGPIELTIDEIPFELVGRTGTALAINGSVPGPIIRLREESDAIIRVTNNLSETSSIHWHGLILPPEMDGVPGVSFAGIQPGETFTYRFRVRQSGTYWCHSHSGGQEQLGVYAPLVIDPIEQEPFYYDREYVVMLSDWSFESPMEIVGKLKNQAGYYNYQKRTVQDFARDIGKDGFSAALSDRLMWGAMLMDPTDIADVTGSTYTYLMNGLPSAANWTALFRSGEKVRLRFIDAAAMTLFDVRIPGLQMTLVQADGQNVKPVMIEEFRIGPGETYDMIVEPRGDEAFTIFAEATDRSGYTSGTLAPKEGMSAAIPDRRMRPLRTMADMGMMKHAGGEHGSQRAVGQAEHPKNSLMSEQSHEAHGAQQSSPVKHVTDTKPGQLPTGDPVRHGPDHHGIGNSSVAEYSQSRLHEPGLGLEDSDRRVLVYADLRRLVRGSDQREPAREIELHITGNMERYMWSFDGKKYSEAKDPIRFHYGERLRLTLVNDTMMEHPIHLHGMWMELENGADEYKPRKHTVTVKPAERLSVAITADAPGRWAFHCHLLLHMEMGMFRVVEVSEKSHEESR